MKDVAKPTKSRHIAIDANGVQKTGYFDLWGDAAYG